MERLTLYEEYRLIERTDAEVNGIWKGAHLLLFFLAFVFGSFCTFCFHMLMYLFDEKCVLFPKLMSLTSLRQNIIYEFLPDDKEAADKLPVDFLSTQWVEKSACLLPTYVPLVSAIFGLVWTTMFLMCSTGSRVLTGLQRPWRVLPPVFLFSLAMGGLCVYTTSVTHYGLQELCLKLSEITGTTSCTYTVNVATLVYERRIRGVYQATRVTIYSAWLHTLCWLLSALLALIRVIFAIDFKLVKVTVQLKGNIDRMLERHETHIRTISPETESRTHPFDYTSSAIRIHFKKKEFRANYDNTRNEEEDKGDLLFYSKLKQERSEQSLLPSEQNKSDKSDEEKDREADRHQFISKMLRKLIDTIYRPSVSEICDEANRPSEDLQPITRQYGQQRLHDEVSASGAQSTEDLNDAQETANQVKTILLERLQDVISKQRTVHIEKLDLESDSVYNLMPETEFKMKKSSEKKAFVPEEAVPSTSKQSPYLKSSMKRAGVQTDKNISVHIDSKTSVFSSKPYESSSDVSKEDKDTQTVKDKQD